MNIRSIAIVALFASIGLTGFNVASADESPATIAEENAVSSEGRGRL